MILQQLAQLHTGAVQSAANRSKLDVEDVGNCGVVELVYFAQHQDDSVVIVHPAKGCNEEFPGFLA